MSINHVVPRLHEHQVSLNSECTALIQREATLGPVGSRWLVPASFTVASGCFSKQYPTCVSNQPSEVPGVPAVAIFIAGRRTPTHAPSFGRPDPNQGSFSSAHSPGARKHINLYVRFRYTSVDWAVCERIGGDSKCMCTCAGFS